MSHMSMCDAPPQRKNRIVDFAGLRSAAASAAGVAAPEARGATRNPANPIVEATRKARRFIAGRKRGEFTDAGGVPKGLHQLTHPSPPFLAKKLGKRLLQYPRYFFGWIWLDLL